ncbi:heterokaryon incompatibility protein-domain-containing protein, partial [Leptodontidium sp. 2 PMI_412]
MSYSYSDSALQPALDEIRLLRLLPSTDENAPLQCQLFKYTLQDSGRRTHLYHALSYVWGDSANPKSFCIGKQTLSVTVNLHKALSGFRHHSIERILWVDAICINQEDTSEKEQQIQIMATIYALASLVVVWLGDAAENSDEALEEICHVARYKNSSNSPRPECTQENAVLALLLRRWFRRIWVLQEVAAARHILVMCGSMEIDGYAFSLGVRSYDFMNSNPQLQGLINSVIYLIEGAIFRPGFVTTSSGRSSLDISTLGELMDMYHTHEATEHHDKIYALLGMSIDDLSKSSLSPDYGLPWEDLFRKLVKFLLHDDVSVEILALKETALIKSQGYILGKVGSVQRNMEGEVDNQWIPHASAKTVRDGDLICLLQGASNPSIVRPHDGYFNVILIVGPPLKDLYESFQITMTRQRNLTLLWDW